MKTARRLARVRLAAAVCAAVLVSSAVASAQSIQAVHAFDYATEGVQPVAPLIQASDGNFYGTTALGGPYSWGTFFKMTPAGVVTVLHAFQSWEGVLPRGGLIQAADGNFYGTASGGGAFGLGTAFKITPAGALTILHSFAGQPSDGTNPYAGFVQTADGTFFSTTAGGGASNLGTIFRMTSSGIVTLVHSFSGATDGSLIWTPLVQTADGNFIGTAAQGGSFGGGTIFTMTPAGVFTVLHPFAAGPEDGQLSAGAIMQPRMGISTGPPTTAVPPIPGRSTG